MTPYLVVGGWLTGWVLFLGLRRFPRPTGADGDALVEVSVIVPARNEARRLPGLLRALAASTPPFELVVVDDGSTDGTDELARVAGATVVRSEPPNGWTGKAAACQRGADSARGEVLVFLDADTRPEPWFVRALASRAWTTRALVSVQPWHRVERGYEHLSAVPNLVAVLGAGTGPPGRTRWWRRPLAFGPAIAVRRDVYAAAGGHRSVRSAVAEDLALAEAADRRGIPVESWCGGGIDYRMYPEGPASLVEGWTKNLSAGAAALPPLRTLAVALWITGVLGSITLVPGGPAGWAAYGAVTLQAGVFLRRVGRFGVRDAALVPVLALAFVALFVVATGRRLLHRPVTWRGRVLPGAPDQMTSNWTQE